MLCILMMIENDNGKNKSVAHTKGLVCITDEFL